MMMLCSFMMLYAPGVAKAQFTYTTNDGGTNITITGGPGGAVNIPSSISGLTVTSIADGAFDGFFLQPNISLTSLTIPGTVTNIAPYAFYYCTALSEVTLSNGVIELGDAAFSDDLALSSITIPGSVINIGDSAFENCSSLTNAIISWGVTSIGNDAFGGCTNLRTLAIAATVTNIGNDAFAACNNLTSITVSGSVGSYAFAYCTGLTNATLSNGVKSIGDYAFLGCSGLTSIVIPSSVTTIGVGAFLSNSLTNLTISIGVSVVGGVAFCGCPLTDVTFPPSVISIGEQAFWFCNSLTNVFFQGNAPALPGDAENGGIFPFVHPAICYYLPGTTGWSNTYQEVPFVLWNPLIQAANGNFGVQNNQFGFDITGTPAIPIVVEASTDLADPVWTALTNVTLTNGLFHFSEPAQSNSPGRYYRIRSP
jgi:hypothetical protein